MKTPTPPEGYSWRPAMRADVPLLRELQEVSNREYGPLDSLARTDYEELFEAGGAPPTGTLCGLDSDGRIIAFASARVHTLAQEHRVHLDGYVHPDFRRRGLGTFLLEWSEARARQMLQALTSGRPRVLTVDFMDRRDDAIHLYERNGFLFKLAEETMRRDLHEPIPEIPLPEGTTLLPWTEENAHLFYETYRDAFHDRPGFPGWTEEIWRQAFTGVDSFQSDLSFVSVEGDTPTGYAVCEVEDEENQTRCRKEGWITQMGVRPAFRGRGVGAAILSAVLNAFSNRGLDDAILDVNVNNPEAQRLYQRLGFATAVRRTAYVKEL